MPESPMVGARVPQDWQQLFQSYCRRSWAEGSLVVREAIAQYLGKTDPSSVRGAITDLQDRVANLERKLVGLGRLVG